MSKPRKSLSRNLQRSNTGSVSRQEFFEIAPEIPVRFDGPPPRNRRKRNSHDEYDRSMP